MALLGATEVGLKKIGGKATVPNNDKSKLMYYLKSVFTVLDDEGDPEIVRLKDYNNHNLTEDETDRLVALCYLLSPDVLAEKCFFKNDEMCEDSINKFYELSVAETKLAVTDEIIIGGKRKQVRKIMVFKLEWIDLYWAKPLKAVIAQREREEGEKERKRLEDQKKERAIQAILLREQQERRQRERERELARQREIELERQKNEDEEKARQEAAAEKEREREKLRQEILRDVKLELAEQKKQKKACCTIL